MNARTLAAAAIPVLLGALLSAGGCGDDPPPPAPVRPALSLIPPLQDAAVGEWLRIKAGDDSELYRVVAATDYELTVELTTYRNDVPVDTPSVLTWHRNGFSVPPDWIIRAYEPDRIQVEGKWWDCWRLSVFSHNAAPRLYWITDQVGVHGVLKVASVDKGQPNERTAARLVDWGPR